MTDVLSIVCAVCNVSEVCGGCAPSPSPVSSPACFRSRSVTRSSAVTICSLGLKSVPAATLSWYRALPHWIPQPIHQLLLLRRPLGKLHTR